MPNTAYQLLDIVGTSPLSSDDAIRSGIEKATQANHRVDWFQVVETRGQVRDGKVTQFQVIMKIGMRLDQAAPSSTTCA
ncbi:MAG: dodecin family protein [Methylococcus sp.]|jgi:dodecin|nr:MAG: dodecin family protein [Methylococcus sp.]